MHIQYRTDSVHDQNNKKLQYNIELILYTKKIIVEIIRAIALKTMMYHRSSP